MKNKSDRCEVLLFAFVWNRATFPLGIRLGKSEDEIADKTLEIISAGEKMINYAEMKDKLERAKQRQKMKSEADTYEKSNTEDI